MQKLVRRNSLTGARGLPPAGVLVPATSNASNCSASLGGPEASGLGGSGDADDVDAFDGEGEAEARLRCAAASARSSCSLRGLGFKSPILIRTVTRRP